MNVIPLLAQELNENDETEQTTEIDCCASIDFCVGKNSCCTKE